MTMLQKCYKFLRRGSLSALSVLVVCTAFLALAAQSPDRVIAVGASSPSQIASPVTTPTTRSLSPAPAPVAPTSASSPLIIAVPASATWVNTGLSVTTGQQLSITASGSWTPYNVYGYFGPDGDPSAWGDNYLNLTDIGVCSSCYSTPTSSWSALIAYIGNAPPAPGSYTSTSILPEAQKVFLVGSKYAAPSPLSGTLWLGFNDDAYSGVTSDNAGQVSATVTVGSAFTISGNVYVDSNKNGVKDPGEQNYSGATVKLSGAASSTTTTDQLGNYSFGGLVAGKYIVTLTLPPSYTKTTTANRVKVTLGPSTPVNFGLAPSLSLLAPVDAGISATVIHGYNDPPPGVNLANNTCDIATSRDHCENQKFGLDLQPGPGWAGAVLAPAPGTPTGIYPGSLGSKDCLLFTLDDRINLTICHFGNTGFQENLLGTHVPRGTFLGTAAGTWIHLNLDDRRNGQQCSDTYYTKVQFYCPIQFASPYTVEGHSLRWNSSTNQLFGNIFPLVSSNKRH